MYFPYFCSDLFIRKLSINHFEYNKIHSDISFLLLSLNIYTTKAQVSDDLQNAMNDVPEVNTAYDADRDRSESPEISSPRAYVFAYYNLPYAIDLSSKQDPVTGISFERVEVDFNSVDLSTEDEKDQLDNAIKKLSQMLDEDQLTAHRKYFRGNVSTGSDLSDISAQGNAIIAQRELLCTKDLYLKLTSRFTKLVTKAFPTKTQQIIRKAILIIRIAPSVDSGNNAVNDHQSGSGFHMTKRIWKFIIIGLIIIVVIFQQFRN